MALTSRLKPIATMLFVWLSLAACSNATQPIASSSGPERFDFALTKENYPDFLELQISKASSIIEVSCKGALSYAYYEDVRITLLFTAVGSDYNGGPQVTRTGTETIKLNAAGNYHHIYYDGFIPADIEPAFTKETFYGYSTSMAFKSISGRILFSV